MVLAPLATDNFGQCAADCEDLGLRFVGYRAPGATRADAAAVNATLLVRSMRRRALSLSRRVCIRGSSWTHGTSPHCCCLLLPPCPQVVPRVYVNDATVGGRCPTAVKGGTTELVSCSLSLPWICGP